jgi:outer membrane protein, multidrug efflux system
MNAVKRLAGLSLTTAGMLTLASCFSLAPEYVVPQSPASAGFKEIQTTAAPAGWKTAEPSDHLPRGEWWKVFADPVLDSLEQQALEANYNLEAAMARVSQVRAAQAGAEANRMPSVDAGFGPSRQQSSQATGDGSVNNIWRAQTSISYEADLFGRVSDGIAAAQADAEKGEANFHSVLLALQADVATRYFQLRSLDAQSFAYQRTLVLREEAQAYTQVRAANGQSSDLELQQASTELASARADATAVLRERARVEHELAVLLGQPPARFSLGSMPITPVRLQLPVGIPGQLLERRPDIAAAERSMAAANARIGVAKSAFFPSLTLSGNVGYEASALTSLFQGSNSAFLLGPLTGTLLNIPLFDGGRRQANLDSARAAYMEQVASYQQTVLVAVREVEDHLADVRLLQSQTADQNAAVVSANRASEISRAQYSEGAIDYLKVIDTQRSMLNAERSQARLYGDQAVATVNLIRALGGGWGGKSTAGQSQLPEGS